MIKSEKQYSRYCKLLENIVFLNRKKDQDEIELLTLLIEKWDEENYITLEMDPIELLKSLMDDHGLKAKDLSHDLQLSKGTVSKILSYQTGLSKKTIRILALKFALSQEAFNRPYKLKSSINKKFKNASLMNTRKKIESGV